MLGKNVFNLVERFGSPLYVYDERILNQRCKEMKQFSKQIEDEIPSIAVKMHYSTKANSALAILKAVKNAGLNVDCMSPFELFIDKFVGFSDDQILYVCNNISKEEMKNIKENNVMICLDSISQVETWGNLFPGTEIFVRINPGVTGVGHSKEVITAGKETKFGISEENIPKLISVAKCYGLKIIGTHQHLGSLFLNDKINEYIEGVKAGLDIVERYFPDIKIVDLGGGFGVPYKPEEKPLDLSLVAQRLIPILKEFVSKHSSVREFKFEPGRYIPCEAGYLLGTVTATKEENGIFWVGTDIGMNQIVRPSMYGSYHAIEVISQNYGRPCQEMKVNFCGNVCESGDILGKDRTILVPSLTTVQVGDIVVVHNAGAYGYSMASNYTGRARPAEVLITAEGDRTGEPVLIRKREDNSTMFRNLVQ